MKKNLPAFQEKDKTIQDQIHHLDFLNKQLLSIQQQIYQTSFFKSNNTKLSPNDKSIEFQVEIRQSLHQLINSITKFYQEIDNKLRNFTSLHGNSFNNENRDLKYEVLFEKVKNLEFSLKNTQENEAKLLQIIQSMIQKYHITDQQTFLGEKYLKNPNIPAQNGLNHKQNSSPSFQNGQIEQSIYEKAGLMDESIVATSMNSIKIHKEKLPENGVFIKRLYSRSLIPNEQKISLKHENRHGNLCGSVNKISFIQTKESVSIEKDKNHRMNFMIDNLQK